MRWRLAHCAFERVIDRLLATQQYGEKWARHWLDLVRYADTSGCNSDFPIPSAYKYRSIYLLQQRIRKNPLLESFDAADANTTIGERPLTTTPLQALFMMNSGFVRDTADQFAVRIGLAFVEEAKQLDYAHQLAFGRHPTKQEIAMGSQYLIEARAHLGELPIPVDQRRRKALESYARVLFSSNEFLFVD